MYSRIQMIMSSANLLNILCNFIAHFSFIIIDEDRLFLRIYDVPNTIFVHVE